MRKITLCAALLCATLNQPAVAEDTPKLHPIEAVCIDYEMAGQMMNGTIKRCHRAWSYESYEIQDGTVGFGGYSQEQHQSTIIIGNTIYVIDLKAQTGTKMLNPLHDKIVASLEGKSPEEMGEAVMTTMGFTLTGESKTIVGRECKVATSAMLGTMCITDDALMLEQSIMGNTRTATAVSIGESGSEEEYTRYTQVPLTDGPDLSKMPGFEKMANPNQQQPNN